MYQRNSYFCLALYILFLIVFSGTLFILVQESSWYAVLPALGIVWMVYGIIRIFNRIPEKISYFFNAIENEDSTLLFSEKIQHKATKEMNRSLNRVNRLIQEVKLRNHEQEQYYSMLLERVATGIVVMNENGSILQANSSAKKLLNYQALAHIEQLKRVDASLYQAFSRLKEESTHQFVKVMHRDTVTQLSLQATTFKNHEKMMRIISIHDISNELDAKEIESWQKLIRVLTHEIMNSITPITSLSETLLKYYIPSEKPTDEKTITNTIKGLEVINERGVGLIRFVESYRKLIKLSQPILKPIALKNLIEHLLLLLENEPNFHRIRFCVETDTPDISVEADETQLSQVFINLIKNAMQAVESVAEPCIAIRVHYTQSGRCEIKIIDNGPGIPPKIMEQIFIPFFTTKENGSGIGLSLSRQIMKNHGGGIDVVSIPGTTVFTLSL
ncbi:MAG: ATP-binding protein [Bacteroidales bacterium]|jgi:two-component system nitrogen regulation sensor histidine kinase NtrY|nr:ATP-binding protein [Bacteroidales bacterium]